MSKNRIFDERVVAVGHAPRSNFALTIGRIAASQLTERVGSVRPTPMIDPVILHMGTNRPNNDPQHNKYRHVSTSRTVTNELVAEKPDHVRMERAVKRHPVEARRQVGANARDGGRKFRRARRQECEVAGRHVVNV